MGTTTTYTYNAANQLLTRSDGTYNFTYAYDQNGNMLAETVGALNTKSYTYDVFDQMVQATHLSTTGIQHM